MPQIRKKSLARALGAGTASVAAAAAAVVATSAPAWAGTTTPITAAVGGTVKVADPGLANVATPMVLLRVDTCAATYTVPTTSIFAAERVTKVSDGVTFGIPANLPLSTNGVARQYNVCVYQGTAAGSNGQVASASNNPVTVYQNTTVNPASGLSGSTGNLALTASTAVLTGVVTPGAIFTAGACPTAYTIGAGSLAATATKSGLANTTATVTIPSGVVGSGAFNVCLYPGTGANDALLTAATYQVTLPQITPSSNSGPYDATNGITLSSGANNMFGGITAPGIVFTSTPTCPSGYDASAAGAFPVPANNVRKIAANRVAITVPKLPLTATNQPLAYQLCVYSGTAADSTLLASTVYTSTILANPIAITPSAGPTTGGMTITVSGTDFPTGPGSISATLGGTPLLDITPVNSTSFTATLPAHSAGEGSALVVTTPAGTKALPGAFSFRDAIKIGTNTAPNTTASIDISVTGSGFLSYPFGGSGDASRIFLTRGEYNDTETTSGERSNSPVAECANVLVISDNELICTLRLDRRLNETADGFLNPATLSQNLADDITTVAGSRIITSVSKAFSPDDVGHVISESGNASIPAGTTIKLVLSPSLAVISAPALLTTLLPIDVNVGGVVRTVAAVDGNGLSTVLGSNRVTLSGSVFTKADVGRLLTGVTGIPDGTTITSVTPSGTSATLSARATAGTGGTLSVTGVTANSTTIAGTFTSADVGSVFGPNTAGIPAGTRIVSQTGNAAVLSAAATLTGAPAAALPVDRPVALTLFPAAPVPEGAYNLSIVSNGAVNASSADPEYRQTALTSGSTFTVGSF